MIEPIFEGVRSRCLNHKDTLLKPGESECRLCRTLRDLKPPFEVKCVRGGFGVKHGEIYTVVWIIRDGRSSSKDNMYGYVFKAAVKDQTALHEYVFDPADFVIVEKEEPKKEEDPEVDWAMLG